MRTFQEQFKKFDGFYSKIEQEMESKKKTPYQLDLEVMERKPDITPKVGDWVKIKSRDWYEKWKNSAGYVNVPGSYYVKDSMAPYCGHVYKVEEATRIYFKLERNSFYWTPPMFEEVYPQEEYAVRQTLSGDIVEPIEKDVTFIVSLPSKNGLISLPYDKGAIEYPTEAIDTLRAKWPPKKEPELQIIKTNHFIQLEKLWKS